MRAPSLSVWEERFFFFADFEQLHKHTYMLRIPVFASILVNTVI